MTGRKLTALYTAEQCNQDITSILTRRLCRICGRNVAPLRVEGETWRICTDLATWKVRWTAGPTAPSDRAGTASVLAGDRIGVQTTSLLGAVHWIIGADRRSSSGGKYSVVVPPTGSAPIWRDPSSLPSLSHLPFSYSLQRQWRRFFLQPFTLDRPRLIRALYKTVINCSYI